MSAKVPDGLDDWLVRLYFAGVVIAVMVALERCAR